MDQTKSYFGSLFCTEDVPVCEANARLTAEPEADFERIAEVAKRPEGVRRNFEPR
jgi:hypothetical protein